MSALPATMKAVLLRETGGPDKLDYVEDQPVPTLKDGQVLIKNVFSGINYVDIYYRTGSYLAPEFPVILGQEAAGTIAAVTDNPFGLKVGDRVLWISQGSYAEYSAIAASQVIKIPTEVSFEDAVGAHLMGMTALTLVEEAYPVKKGQTVLVHAAAGGVGLLMCQILHDIGAVIIGTAGGPEKCKLAKENGATHAIDYSLESPSWNEQVMELTNGKGVDVVSAVMPPSTISS